MRGHNHNRDYSQHQQRQPGVCDEDDRHAADQHYAQPEKLGDAARCRCLYDADIRRHSRRKLANPAICTEGHTEAGEMVVELSTDVRYDSLAGVREQVSAEETESRLSREHSY